MAKRLTLFSLRLFFLSAIAVIISAMLFMIGNTVVQWCADILITIMLLVFVWIDAVGIGQKDTQKDKIIKHRMAEQGYEPTGEEGKRYQAWFGFAAGFLSQILAVGLVIALCFLQGAPKIILSVVLKVMYLNYLQIINSIPNAFPLLCLVPPVLISIVSGLAYLNGPVQQQKLETIIERNKMKKAKRVQDDLKNKKKRKGQRERPDIRRE